MRKNIGREAKAKDRNLTIVFERLHLKHKNRKECQS